MAEKKKVQEGEESEVIIAKAKDFWERYNKPLVGISLAVIIIVGGYFAYKNFFKSPKEEKAADMMFKAEEYYRMDSLNLALNGDGQYPGFLRVIDKYGGTDAGNLASFYAGSIYLKMGDNANAVKYLKKFGSNSKPIQARAWKLLADAYADQGNNKDALDYYKKAARHFEEDKTNSADYLFHAAYLADRVMKNQKEAIELYKEIREKYPRTQQGFEAENYLAQLGVYSVEE